ncbi:hypothetical protein [Gordonia sp. (in: high G+C Gram-positive bacteria)]|uniref:hypothetical protein n=1 Tax=Gordonia sp. (in: high G+C Gram-positive bacteria) TaxID=84139 RepID=UPI003F9B7C55
MTRIPLCDALIAAQSTLRANFHATPSGGEPHLDDPELAGTFDRLFGATRRFDQSWSHASLDSFHRPDRALHAAQRLAADAFGVDRTYFLSTGASTANIVATTSALARGGRVLLDPTAHQSLHFTVERDAGAVDLMPCNGDTINVDAAHDLLVERSRDGRPPDVVILAASSYDGRRLDCRSVLPRLAAAAPRARFILDDAWCALHTFAPRTSGSGPVAGITQLRADGLTNPVLVVHSAHKTMLAMRQAAYLHVSTGGEPDLASRVSQSVFIHHTTSPSWPILASLDIAREHAVRSGAQAVECAAAHAADLRRRIDSETVFTIGTLPPVPGYTVDPLRVHIEVPARFDAEQCRRRLWDESGIHISRISAGRLVVAMTLGVSDSAIDALIAGLRSVGRPPGRRREAGPCTVISNAPFVIAYPPGIPLATPFEQRSTSDEFPCIGGSELFEIDPRWGTR